MALSREQQLASVLFVQQHALGALQIVLARLEQPYIPILLCTQLVQVPLLELGNRALADLELRLDLVSEAREHTARRFRLRGPDLDVLFDEQIREHVRRVGRTLRIGVPVRELEHARPALRVEANDRRIEPRPDDVEKLRSLRHVLRHVVYVCCNLDQVRSAKYRFSQRGDPHRHIAGILLPHKLKGQPRGGDEDLRGCSIGLGKKTQGGRRQAKPERCAEDDQPPGPHYAVEDLEGQRRSGPVTHRVSKRWFRAP